jgi:hypothetical protein
LDLGEIGSDEAHPISSTSDWKQWPEQDCWFYRKPCEGASKNSIYIRVIPAWGLDKHRVKWTCKASYSGFNHPPASVSKKSGDEEIPTLLDL